MQVQTAGAQGWFNIQSYFAPTSTTTETLPEQKGTSYGSLDKTTTRNSEPQPEVDEWHWDHEQMLDEPENETKSKDSKTQLNDDNDDGWNDAEWGEPSSWSNEGWSSSSTNTNTKSKTTSKKGD